MHPKVAGDGSAALWPIYSFWIVCKIDRQVVCLSVGMQVMFLPFLVVYGYEEAGQALTSSSEIYQLFAT